MRNGDGRSSKPGSRGGSRRLRLSSRKVVVVKIGTSSVTTRGGTLDRPQLANLARQISAAYGSRANMVLVTSGAVAAGISELGLSGSPKDVLGRQVAAAAGQGVLMSTYRELFGKWKVKVAQILLTADDLSNHTSYKHTTSVLKNLLGRGVLPIVNENDVTSTDELKPSRGGFGGASFSDNDILSVLVANALRADLLVILSDVDGLYTANPTVPGAHLIRLVERITPQFKRSFYGKGKYGRGGIESKIRAAEIAGESGLPLVIANSRRKNVLSLVLDGEDVGTYFRPSGSMNAMKKWIIFGAPVRGRIIISQESKARILSGSPLSPEQVLDVDGSFESGEVVALVDNNGVEFARGNSRLNSVDLLKVKGMSKGEPRPNLETVRSPVISRRNLHLVSQK